MSGVSVSAHSLVPELYYNPFQFEDTPNGPVEKMMARYQIDRAYFQTMGIPMLAGNLTAAFDSDSSGYVVINEAALNEAGWEKPEKSIGARVSFTRPSGTEIVARIAGVSANFHLEAPHKPVEPMVMEYWREAFAVLHVRIADFNMSQLSLIEQAFKEIYPSLPLSLRSWTTA